MLQYTCVYYNTRVLQYYSLLFNACTVAKRLEKYVNIITIIWCIIPPGPSHVPHYINLTSWGRDNSSHAFIASFTCDLRSLGGQGITNHSSIIPGNLNNTQQQIFITQNHSEKLRHNWVAEPHALRTQNLVATVHNECHVREGTRIACHMNTTRAAIGRAKQQVQASGYKGMWCSNNKRTR